MSLYLTSKTERLFIVLYLPFCEKFFYFVFIGYIFRRRWRCSFGILGRTVKCFDKVLGFFWVIDIEACEYTRCCHICPSFSYVVEYIVFPALYDIYRNNRIIYVRAYLRLMFQYRFIPRIPVLDCLFFLSATVFFLFLKRTEKLFAFWPLKLIKRQNIGSFCKSSWILLRHSFGGAYKARTCNLC